MRNEEEVRSIYNAYNSVNTRNEFYQGVCWGLNIALSGESDAGRAVTIIGYDDRKDESNGKDINSRNEGSIWNTRSDGKTNSRSNETRTETGTSKGKR